VRKLREQLSLVVDETFGLDNRKAQLQLSMEERAREVGVHADVLRAQLKAAEDERHRVAKMLAERELLIDKLRAKFAVVAGRVLAPEDGSADGGGGGAEGSNSQAYYVIRAAQEREELQREGDALDEQIHKTERELRALEKTLNHLYAKNQAYRQSFALVDPSAPLFEQKMLLEEQGHAAVGKFREARLEQAELEEDLSAMHETQAEVDRVSAGSGGGLLLRACGPECCAALLLLRCRC
jgi:UDP-glucose:O-linked fucose beta-1,3-glucosyltransferase